MSKEVTKKDILNCKLDFECPQQWANLTPTDDSGVQYCQQCQKNVYLCLTQAELDTALAQGKCVSFFDLNSILPKNPNPELMERLVSVDVEMRMGFRDPFRQKRVRTILEDE